MSQFSIGFEQTIETKPFKVCDLVYLFLIDLITLTLFTLFHVFFTCSVTYHIIINHYSDMDVSEISCRFLLLSQSWVLHAVLYMYITSLRIPRNTTGSMPVIFMPVLNYIISPEVLSYLALLSGKIIVLQAEKYKSDRY